MKGIILSGGLGTRLYPITKAFSKQLLPVYNKPMIYYPLSLLLLSGIKEILLITTPTDIDLYKKLLGDGSQWGVKLAYKIQDKPNGLAEALLIGEKFLDGGSCCLVLGDNFLYMDGLKKLLHQCSKIEEGSVIFGYHVSNPKDYGVIEFSEEQPLVLDNIVFEKVKSIEEKPKNPKSNYSAIGLYFYDQFAVEYAKQIRPSARGELEITALNDIYLKKQQLKAVKLGRGAAWLDMGTHDSLLAASNFVQTIEKRQGFKIGDLDEVSGFEK